MLELIEISFSSFLIFSMLVFWTSFCLVLIFCWTRRTVGNGIAGVNHASSLSAASGALEIVGFNFLF